MELLTTVAAISSVAAVGVGVVTQVQTVTADIKLEEDVKQANNAIAVYLTAGGSLNELIDPQAVLDKLKSKVSEEEGNDREIMFLKGSVVDLRVRTVGMDEPWRRGNKLARYNADRQRFEVVYSEGENTVQGFALGDVGEQAADRRTVVFKQAKLDNWVWDHGASEEQYVGDVPLDSPTTPEETTTHEPIIASRIDTALMPEIHSELPQTALRNYPLKVTLTDSNPAGLTRLFYRLDQNGAQGVYLPYTGSLSDVEPGATVAGYAASMNTELLYDSGSTRQNFTPDPVTPRLKDNLAPNATYFALGGPVAAGSSAPAPATSLITLDNADEIPQKYQTSDGFSVEINYNQRAQAGITFDLGYTGDPLSPALGDFANGPLTVRYRAVARNTALFTTSEETSKTVQATVLPLAAPLPTVENNTITLTADTAAGPLPANYRIFYRFGADPGDVAGEPASGATAYTTAIPAPAGGDTLYARVYPPTAYKAWFSTSGSTSIEIEGEEDAPNYMGEYDVIVFTDIVRINQLRGKSWTGGSWLKTNSFDVAQNYTPGKPENVTVIGGTIAESAGQYINIDGGVNSKLALKNAASRGSRPINWNGGGNGNESNRVVYDAEIPAKTAAMKTQLTALSQKLATATANSTVVTPQHESNARVLECRPNADGVAIFNIPATSLFGASNLAQVRIGVPSGVSESSVKGILINVTGTTVKTGNQFNFTGNFTNDAWRKKILWNFHEATALDMAAQQMNGAVLAPKATVKSNNYFYGSLVCEKLDLDGGTNRVPFEGTIIFESVK